MTLDVGKKENFPTVHLKFSLYVYVHTSISTIAARGIFLHALSTDECMWKFAVLMMSASNGCVDHSTPDIITLP